MGGRERVGVCGGRKSVGRVVVGGGTQSIFVILTRTSVYPYHSSRLGDTGVYIQVYAHNKATAWEIQVYMWRTKTTSRVCQHLASCLPLCRLSKVQLGST